MVALLIDKSSNTPNDLEIFNLSHYEIDLETLATLSANSKLVLECQVPMNNSEPDDVPGYIWISYILDVNKFNISWRFSGHSENFENLLYNNSAQGCYALLELVHRIFDVMLTNFEDDIDNFDYSPC
jgi:hypothetical protein